MKDRKHIPVSDLCQHYAVKQSFFVQLSEHGLVEVHEVNSVQCILEDNLSRVERILRIHQELNVNLEGVDVVLNLLDRVQEMERELNELRNTVRAFREN